MVENKREGRSVARTFLSATLAAVLVAGMAPIGGLAGKAYAEGAPATAEGAPATADASAASEKGAVEGAGDGAGISEISSEGQAAGEQEAEAPEGAASELGAAADGSASPTPAETAAAPAASPESVATQDTLDPTALANGTYTVSVSLVKADDLSASSMAASAFDGTDTLTVVDGSYVIALDLGTVQVGSITGSVMQLAYYPTYTVGANSLATSGDYTVAFATTQTGDHGPANVPVGATAKTNSVGYVALRLWSDAMGSASQLAALKIDWSSLSKTSDTTDSSAFDTNVNATILPEAQTDSPASSEEAAAPAGSQKFGGVYEKGHVYSVPITFKKENSSETSMAAQYFGSSATVRLNDDDTFTVRFSTNRPDYLLSIKRNGTELGVQSETSTSREYSMNLPATTADTVVPLSMSVKPMIELGSGPVTTDMHIAFSQASDLGGDSGQTASSMPKTGDPLGALPVGLGVTAALGAFAAAGSRRKMKESE